MKSPPLLIVLTLPILAMTGSEEGHWVRAVLSPRKDGPDQRELSAAIEKVWLRLELQGFKAGTTLTSVFIAENTEPSPADHTIDRVALKVGGLINRVQCSLNRPTKGWPAGKYRVEVYLGHSVQAILVLRFSIVS